MGDNTAYSSFQHTVITIYDHGVLTPELLDELAEEVGTYDIDSGGDTGLLAKDGKDLIRVCISIIEPDYNLSPEEGEKDEEYWTRLYDKWCDIHEGRWGW